MKKFILFLTVVSSVFFLTACDDDSPTESSDPDKAQVMVVHASPDAPAVDLLVDGSVAGTGLAFPQNTGYLEVTAGTRNVQVNVSVTNPAITVLQLPVVVEKDKNYTVFAIDSVANLSVLPVEDNLTAPAAGNAHVRFFHLSPNAPAVDITDVAGNIVFGDRSFTEYTEFTPLPAGTYNLQVRAQGTSTVVMDLPGIVLENGKIYTVFARGFLGGAGDQALNAEIIINN
jgi:hypothetical protein